MNIQLKQLFKIDFVPQYGRLTQVVLHRSKGAIVQ
jgi:hypothetical protein